MHVQSGHKVKEENSPSFPGSFQSHNYTFAEVVATKLKVMPRLGLDKIVSNCITDDSSQQNFTQARVILCKYSITLKLFYLL